MNGIPTSNEQALRWLTRARYRSEFHLTSREMDAEPYDEVKVMMRIWEFEQRRQELENRRREQSHGREND